MGVGGHAYHHGWEVCQVLRSAIPGFHGMDRKLVSCRTVAERTAARIAARYSCTGDARRMSRGLVQVRAKSPWVFCPWQKKSNTGSLPICQQVSASAHL